VTNFLTQNSQLYCKCELCKDLIGPSAPAIQINYGFPEEEGFYTQVSSLMHVECAGEFTMSRLLQKMEDS